MVDPGTDFRTLDDRARRALIERARKIDQRSRCPVSGALRAAYRYEPLRGTVVEWAKRLEGGRFYSRTLRDVLRDYHDVEVGMYSYGRCLWPEFYPPGSRVGSYCSFGTDPVRFEKPRDRVSQHPLFWDDRLGLVEGMVAPVREKPLEIGHDVYGGRNVVLLPGCSKVGDGAVIGNSAVVAEDVPPYAIVVGNPARFLRKRFTPEVEAAVRASDWHRQPLSKLVEEIETFLNPASEALLARTFGTPSNSGRPNAQPEAAS